MSVYEHFNKDERVFIDNILTYKQRVEDTYVPVVTHFLNPREQFILQSLFSKHDAVHYVFFDTSERTRAMITYPDGYDRSQFDVSYITIDYAHKFETLKHSAILGTLVNSGLKREMIGDIVTNGKQWQVMVATQIVPHILMTIDKIGGVKVRLHVTDTPIERLEQNVQETVVLVSSLRVDTLIAAVFNVSRQLAKALIERGDVLVNWKTICKSETTINQKDTVSIRRYGRVVLYDNLGQTKKEKLKISVKVYKNKR